MIFDGSELLPSAVFLGSDGEMLTGRDALDAARTAPDRFEPHPKRCVDDRAVLLGGVEVTVVDLLAAPLRRVAAEAPWDPDAAAGSVTVTCPAGWAATRQGSLTAHRTHPAGLCRCAMCASTGTYHVIRRDDPADEPPRLVDTRTGEVRRDGCHRSGRRRRGRGVGGVSRRGLRAGTAAI
ncbi:hypothetical protein GCM10009557_09640 [Virgisporangium ochraceum]|uniref:Uncharacterized protein n=1 Tax=Virgisporangium ochraceum TaxID=65505 RepID=A0A8J3ZWF3_9ACTN|nr:hypothetical protein Voc01_063040 [Virgisporangium ochraceum]